MDSEQTTEIVRAVLALGRRLRAERPAGSVSLAALSILATLYRLGPVPAVRLAAEEQLQPQSLTRLLAALDRDGMILRTPGATDRRELTIHLTARGLAALSADIRARRQWLDGAIAATLSAEEAEALLRAADAMLKLAAHGAGPSDADKGIGGCNGRQAGADIARHPGDAQPR